MKYIINILICFVSLNIYADLKEVTLTCPREIYTANNLLFSEDMQWRGDLDTGRMENSQNKKLIPVDLSSVRLSSTSTQCTYVAKKGDALYYLQSNHAYRPVDKARWRSLIWGGIDTPICGNIVPSKGKHYPVEYCLFK